MILQHKHKPFVEPWRQRRSPLCDASHGEVMMCSAEECAVALCYDSSGQSPMERVKLTLFQWTLDGAMDRYRLLGIKDVAPGFDLSVSADRVPPGPRAANIPVADGAEEDFDMLADLAQAPKRRCVLLSVASSSIVGREALACWSKQVWS